VAAVGDDPAGRLLIGALGERGVDTEDVRQRDAPTGTMLVVTQEGERSMVADRGANTLLAPEDLPGSLDAGAVLVSGYLLLQEPTTRTAVAVLERARTPRLAVEAASWPLVDRFGPQRFFELTERADVVLANVDEARALTGESGNVAAAALGERFRIAVVKRGDEGVSVSDDGQMFEHRAEPVREVDPTGAGDAFDGVFLGLLAQGVDVSVAVGRACAAGAVVASRADMWPEEEPQS
jgi:sugar/nucleoside kinase (ribokinase family)